MTPLDDLPLPKRAQPRADASLVIDCHGHFGAPAADALLAARPERAAEMGAMALASGPASHRRNAEVVLPAAGERMASLEKRLRDLDDMGCDMQVVSPSPHLYAYWADAVLADELVACVNEAGLALAARQPKRLIPLALVGLQHPEQAARQLRKAMAAGMRGAEISASVGPHELSDRRFDPFWAEAEALSAVIFIHPLGSSLGQRLDRYYLSNIVAQPTETTIGLAHLIMGGVLDRFPKLRILGAHGGGYLPAYIGRCDHGWSVRPEARECALPPSHYLARIWVDTVVFDAAQLRNLVARMGADRIAWGTDYPFDMGDYHPDITAGWLDPAQRAAVMGRTALELFGLTAKSTLQGSRS